MDTGVFSVSLSVSDINSSKEFYEKLGFEVFSGNVDAEYLYMKKGNNIIKLFQWGIFDGNFLTLNPNWDDNLQTKEKLVDFPEIRDALIKKGINIEKSSQLQEPDVNSFFIRDPDGNKILIEEIGI